jgi:hypothetical protein
MNFIYKSREYAGEHTGSPLHYLWKLGKFGFLSIPDELLQRANSIRTHVILLR